MKRAFLLILLCWPFLSVSTLANATLFEWSVTSGGNGHCYEPVLGMGIWDDANANAVARGGYLATITSAAENEFIYGLIMDSAFWFNGSKGPWLGGVQPQNSPEPGGNWTWITGEVWGYTNWWWDGQPDNAGGNQCYLSFEGGPLHGGAYWDDMSPTGITPGYIVEYPVGCLPVPVEPLTWSQIKSLYR